MKMTLKIIGNFFFYGVAAILLFSIVIELFSPDKTIDIIGFKSFVVVSRSMEPVINVNDIVIVTKVDDDELEVGDIISFYAYLPTIEKDTQGNTIYQRSVVTHYLGELIQHNGETIIKTYGTSNAEGVFDTWTNEQGIPTELTTEDILGRVSFKIPWIGFILLLGIILTQNPIFFGLVVLNIVIIIVLIKVIRKPRETNI